MLKVELIKTLKRVGWLGLILLMASLIISAVARKGASSVSGLSVTIEPLPGGHLLVDEKDVLLTIDRSFGFELPGKPVAGTDVGRLEKVLEEDPFILDANVYIDARNEINIEVVQREPVLRIMDNNGLNYYLDESGLKMPLSNHFTARVLVATGNIPPHVPDFLERKRHTLKDLFELAGKLRADPFFDPLIDQVHVSNQREFTLIPKVGDQKIILGPYEHIDEKLRNLKVFYQEGIAYEGWQKYRTINLQYRGQVVCKRR